VQRNAHYDRNALCEMPELVHDEDAHRRTAPTPASLSIHTNVERGLPSSTVEASSATVECLSIERAAMSSVDTWPPWG
jgi:hypothetical protein